MPRTPYNIRDTDKRLLISEALKLAYEVKIDELACDQVHRNKTDKTLEEVLEFGFNSKNTLWTFLRKDCIVDKITFYDIGFKVCPTSAKSYFLWIKCSPANGQALIEKFNLTEIQY